MSPSDRRAVAVGVVIAVVVGGIALVMIAVIVGRSDGEDETTLGQATVVGATAVGTWLAPLASPNETASAARTAIAIACGQAATPEPVRQAVVGQGDIRLREGPGIKCRTIEFVPEGTAVEVLSGMTIDEDGNIWSRVRRVDTGTEGWMGFTFLDMVSEPTPAAGS